MTDAELEKKWENTPWDTDIYLDDIDEEMKPCPFCGGVARIDKLYENEWYVYCPKCERHYDTEQEAIEHWNKRVVAE